MPGNTTAVIGLFKKYMDQPHRWLLLLLAALISESAYAELCTLQDASKRQQSEFAALLSAELNVQQHFIGAVEDGELATCELIVTLGSTAAKRAADWDGPVIHAMLSREHYHSLYPSEPAYWRSAIYLDTPLHRYIALIDSTLPRHKEILVFGSERSEPLYRELESEAQRVGRHVRMVPYRSGMLFDQLLQRHADANTVLLVLPDTNVLNSDTARALIMAAYQRAVPLVSYSPGLVRAGALMAVYSSPAHQVAAVEESIRQWQHSGQLATATYVPDYDISINYQLARAMRLRIPAEPLVIDRMGQVDTHE